jgi:ribose transport system ATP-binding protein
MKPAAPVTRTGPFIVAQMDSASHLYGTSGESKDFRCDSARSFEAGRLFDFITRFRSSGGAIFYISHRLDEVLQLSDRISVLRDGKFIIELDPKRTNKDEIVRHMAGREVATLNQRKSQPSSRSPEVVLKVRDLSRKEEFEGVNLELHRGEILRFRD